MKKLITFLLLIVAIGVNAQAVKVKSKSPLADSIWMPRGAIEVSPLVTGSGGDTIRTIDYKLHPYRDTLQFMDIAINSYNKNAGLIQTDYIQVPQSLFNRWKALINAMDAYIQAQRKRINKL